MRVTSTDKNQGRLRAYGGFDAMMEGLDQVNGAYLGLAQKICEEYGLTVGEMEVEEHYLQLDFGVVE